MVSHQGWSFTRGSTIINNQQMTHKLTNKPVTAYVHQTRPWCVWPFCWLCCPQRWSFCPAAQRREHLQSWGWLSWTLPHLGMPQGPACLPAVWCWLGKTEFMRVFYMLHSKPFPMMSNWSIPLRYGIPPPPFLCVPIHVCFRTEWPLWTETPHPFPMKSE